jgi:hypothetical protein
LSSGESKFLCKRNPKEGGERMQERIMRLPTAFIGRRREWRWYRGGEMVDEEWSRKEHVRRLLVPAWRGNWRM